MGSEENSRRTEKVGYLSGYENDMEYPEKI